MILILTEPSDLHANHVIQKLRKLDANFLQFNPVQFPSQANITLSYSPEGQINYTLQTNSDAIDLRQIKAIWYRRPEEPVPHSTVTEKLRREFVEEECKTFLNDVWDALDCIWLPGPPNVTNQAKLKASQLKVAGMVGFELPPTLFTNSPEEFLAFYRRYNGQIVSKLTGFSFFNTVGTTFNRYTEVVSKRDVGYANAVQYCPIIFQAYVPKRLELRITVVGEKVFSAEIHSQISNHTRHDWRRYDHFQTPYQPHDLPDDVAQRCVQLVQQLGLRYGAIDMVLTPDGRYVFLEINPNGQYLWIEEKTGLPISDAICDLLLSSSPDKAPSKGELEPYLGGSQ